MRTSSLVFGKPVSAKGGQVDHSIGLKLQPGRARDIRGELGAGSMADAESRWATLRWAPAAWPNVMVGWNVRESSKGRDTGE
jgi:hypothetical protein